MIGKITIRIMNAKPAQKPREEDPSPILAD
jgi:hypothetical protein